MKNILQSNWRYDSTEKLIKMDAILHDQANLFYPQQRIRQYPFSAMPTPNSYHCLSPSVMHLNTTGLLWFLKRICSTINMLLVLPLFAPSPSLWLLSQPEKLACISGCHTIVASYLLNCFSRAWPPVPPSLTVSLNLVQCCYAVTKIHPRAAARS